MNVRDKITECAGDLFIKQGTKQVTMDNIAQTLCISKRTIYENFKDKNELLYTFLLEAMINHKKKCVELINNSDNVIEALFLFGEYNRKMTENITPLFFEDLKKYHHEVFHKVIENKHVRNYDVTYTILKRGINEGSFRKDIDVEIANMFMHYAMDFFKIADNKNIEHKKIWKSVHLPYLRGICTEKGQELIEGLIKKSENQNE